MNAERMEEMFPALCFFAQDSLSACPIHRTLGKKVKSLRGFKFPAAMVSQVCMPHAGQILPYPTHMALLEMKKRHCHLAFHISCSTLFQRAVITSSF